MIRSLFWAGSALTAGVLLVMVADFVAHSTPTRAPVLPTPEGFSMNLKGVGPVEVAFTGGVELVTDEREEAAGGGAVRVPRWKVNGSDPVPEGAGMAIVDTRIEALSTTPDGDAPLIANTPRAWIPLKRDSGLLTLDLGRTWRLADPVLDLPGFRRGSRMTARARGMTELRPREESVIAHGPFQLEAENLALQAAGFSYDAATGRISFEPWQGEVRWSITDAAGRVLRGFSDSGGAILPTEDDGLMLRFDEGLRGIRTAVPSGKNQAPATMLARSLDLVFTPGADGAWQLKSASARGPLLLSDARLALEGGGAEISWNALDGSLREARIAGPLAVHPWEPPIAAATARESAVYDAANGSLLLDGRAWAADARGFLAADSLRWDGAALQADGQVLAHAEHGTALADRAAASEKDGIRARGHVRLLPTRGMVQELTGPELVVNSQGEAEIGGGFEAHGQREGVDWRLSGVRLRQWMEEDGSPRAEAFGPLLWSEPGLRIEGGRFKQLAEREFRFEGSPARAWITLDDGSEAQASFRRADYGANALHLEGEPWLSVPAAALGLSGEPVELRARSVNRDHATGAWDLQGGVRVSGALRTEVDRATWSPTEGLQLIRRLTPPIVEGSLADGTNFRVSAQEFGIDAERVLRLRGAAQGRFSPPDGSRHEFWAEQLWASEFGGVAETDARIVSTLGSGKGDRLEWRSAEGALVWLKATGHARIEREDLTAEGNRIEADQVAGWVEAEGSPEQPAYARTRDGREVRAVWIHYNTVSHLLDSRQFRTATPAPPR